MDLRGAQFASKGQLSKFNKIKSESGEVLNAYISVANCMVIDKEINGRYYRYIFGTRGGWMQTDCCKCYDFEQKEPYRKIYSEKL